MGDTKTVTIKLDRPLKDIDGTLMQDRDGTLLFGKVLATYLGTTAHAENKDVMRLYKLATKFGDPEKKEWKIEDTEELDFIVKQIEAIQVLQGGALNQQFNPLATPIVKGQVLQILDDAKMDFKAKNK